MHPVFRHLRFIDWHDPNDHRISNWVIERFSATLAPPAASQEASLEYQYTDDDMSQETNYSYGTASSASVPARWT